MNGSPSIPCSLLDHHSLQTGSCYNFDPIWSSTLVRRVESSVRLRGLEVLVLHEEFVVLLSSHGLQRPPLDLARLVVQEDPNEHQGSARGAEDGDLVTEHDDAEPHWQGVLHSAGNTEEQREAVNVGVHLGLIQPVALMRPLTVYMSDSLPL